VLEIHAAEEIKNAENERSYLLLIRFRGWILANVERESLLGRRDALCHARCQAGANFNRFLNPRIYRRPTLAGNVFKTSRRSIRRTRGKRPE